MDDILTPIPIDFSDLKRGKSRVSAGLSEIYLKSSEIGLLGDLETDNFSP
jgi:hypothetical protein